MASKLPWRALDDILADDFSDSQSDIDKPLYIPYSFTQGLRKAMGHLSPENIQQLQADRSYNIDRDKISCVERSSISDIFSGEVVQRKQFELDYNKADDGDFPWIEISSLLGQPSIIYDLPVRKIVVRFYSDEFAEKWKDTIESAIDIDGFPSSWIEQPFFAVLESQEPGDSDARVNIRGIHDEFYYKPMFESEEEYEGMDWSIRSLDVRNVWSYQGFINRPEPILTTRRGDRQFNWTPRKIEKYVMNFFDPSENYSGAFRNNPFASLWRRAYSTDVTSLKRFEWEEGEEWVLTDTE